MIDLGAKEAVQALNDIEQIVQRVRQSRIYDISSQIMIAAGVLVLAGNLANFVAPRQASLIWITVNVLTVASAAALSTMSGKMAGGKRMFMHLIEAEDVIRELAGSSKMNGTWKFLTHLFELGRQRCDKWLEDNYDSIGAKGTVDLQARYL